MRIGQKTLVVDDLAGHRRSARIIEPAIHAVGDRAEIIRKFKWEKLATEPELSSFLI
jgi:hypothetical protein